MSEVKGQQEQQTESKRLDVTCVHTPVHFRELTATEGLQFK